MVNKPFVYGLPKTSLLIDFKVIIQTFYCVGGLLNVLWYYSIRNYLPILIFFYGIPTLIVGGFLIFFVQDTPFSLITFSTPPKIVKSLNFIAKVNRNSTRMELS